LTAPKSIHSSPDPFEVSDFIEEDVADEENFTFEEEELMACSIDF